ncbi:putative methyltransferase [Kingella potus]|uniref:site-specific DNA-methyltransferase (adenine-specific) n=1 Tax=Kingella potus TaxID=265175 RepID=A0A377QYJ3_9NEIS|nr:site-specific DNA-methyltransferase [Kingella potus]STR00444.1 putative methyltransferase [Kingella potus]
MATEPNRTEIIPELENNFNENKLLQLKNIFPEAFCENQIDWEKLKLILGADNLAHQNERYQLNWAGKSEAYRTLQTPTSNTLSPCPDESVDFDGTKNLFIEAENLEALKILQKAYAGSVKMIYIDPPYNTGNDSFVYPDKFSETREEYARRVGDKDDAGYLKRDGVFQGAWRKNSKDSGHYHSNWLSMILPRLHLARTLLRDDGVIFISIDDNEQAQLKLLCDEVFGAENFVSQICWQKKYAVSNDDPGIAAMHDFILVYQKSSSFQRNLLPRTEKQLSRYKNLDNDPRGVWSSDNYVSNKSKSERPTLWYPIIHPKTGEEVWPSEDAVWRYSYDKHLQIEKENRLYWGENFSYNKPRLKRFLSEIQDGIVPSTWWSFEETGHNDEAQKETGRLIGKKIFSTPKPIRLLSKLFSIGGNSDDLILDFFSGSGTTAHAVMQLNAEDGGNRRYICIQLPEETDEKSEARKAGFDTIAEIAKERIRRAGGQISGSLKSGQSVDTGFKVFKLAQSSFKPWRQPAGGADGLMEQLEMYIDPVQPDARPEDMAYELMLRLGLKLSCPVRRENGVFWVQDEDTGRATALLTGLADGTRLDEALIDQVIGRNPAKVAVLDRLFDGNDALKTNTVLQMRDAGITFLCV